MKISIITVVYNGEKFIADCINSVLSQDFPNIEYIIIDGASTDSTANIIRSFGNKIHKFISEKDAGLYFAMNKGIELATGDVIAILNSDDMYFDSKVISKVATAFEQHNVDAVYGNVVFVKQNNTKEVVRYWRNKPMYPRYFEDGEIPHHLALFVKKSAYLQFGNLNTTYRIAADHEFMLRLFKVKKASSYFLDQTLTTVRLGGVSNRNAGNVLKGNLEIMRAWKENNLGVPLWCLFVIRPIKKIRQIFMKFEDNAV